MDQQFLHCRPTYCLPDDLFSLIFIAKQTKVLVANIVGSPCSHTTQHSPFPLFQIFFFSWQPIHQLLFFFFFFGAQSLHSPKYAGTHFPSRQCSDTFGMFFSLLSNGGDAKRSFKYWSICVWWVFLGLWPFVCFLMCCLEGRRIQNLFLTAFRNIFFLKQRDCM